MAPMESLPPEAAHGLLAVVREYLGMIVWVCTIGFLALVQRLGGLFVSSKDFAIAHTRIAELEEQVAAQFERYADLLRLIERNAQAIETIRQYGSTPVHDLGIEIRRIGDTLIRYGAALEQLTAAIERIEKRGQQP